MPGDGSRSQGNAAAFGPLFFLLWPAEGGNVCRGSKCRLRGDMSGGARGRGLFGCRFFCYGLPRDEMLSKGETLAERSYAGRFVWPDGRCDSRSVWLPVCSVAAAGFWWPVRTVADSFGEFFCRGGWPVFGFAGFPGRFSRRRFFRRLPAAGLSGLICLSADFPGCRFVRRSACRCGRLSSPIRRKCQ